MAGRETINPHAPQRDGSSMSALELPSRIPPHNLDAERAVLGAILLEGREALPRVVEVRGPPDFYTEAHRSIYYAMQNLFDRGEPVDLLTLQEELRRTDQLPLVGGPAALALLVEQGSVAAYLTSYTAIVRDMAVLRELIQTSSHIIAQAFEAKEDVQTLVDDAERKIFGLAERRLEGSALPIGKILRNTFEYIERLYERKEHVTGVATGFEKLDLETSGFQPSDFIIIAGRPSMGKAQPLDARIKTATGWKLMGDLRLGDELASVDGRRSLVSGIFPQGARPVYRVTFSDGRSTRGSSPGGRGRRDAERADERSPAPGSLGITRRGEVHSGQLSERLARRADRPRARTHGYRWVGRALGEHAILLDERAAGAQC